MIARAPTRTDADAARQSSVVGDAATAGPSNLSERGIAAIGQNLPAWLRPSVLSTMATHFGTFGITAVQGVMLARMLGPQGRGEYGTATFYATTLTFIGMLGAQFAIARRAANEPTSTLRLSQSVMWVAMFTGSLTILAVALLAFTTLPVDKQFLAPLCVVCVLVMPLEHMRQFLMAVDQGSGAFKRFNLVVLSTSIVFPLLLLPLWLSGRASVPLVVFLSLVPPMLGLVLRLAVVKPRPRWSTDVSPPPSELVREGTPFLFSIAVVDLYQRLDQFLILWMGSLVVQGLYAAAVPAASLLQVGATALALFSFNSGSRRNSTMTSRELITAGATLATFQLVTGLAFAMVVGPLIILFYGAKFAAAVPFALALIPAHAINGFVQVVEGRLRGRGNVKAGIWARVAAAAAMVVVVMLLFGRLRELSIPVAATVANGLVAIVLTWFALTDMRGEAEVQTP